MSNRICGRCKSSAVVPWNNVKDFYKCMNCSAMGYAEKFPEKTVFDRLVTSSEVLAPKFIYEATTCDGDGHVLSGYRSTVTTGFWVSEAEAIAATVAKLKEVCNAERH